MITLQRGETVIAKARKHWFIFAADVAVLGLALLLPLILYHIFSSVTPEIEAPPGLPQVTSFLDALLRPSYFVLGYFFWAICIWLLIVAVWTSYYLDIWIITNERLYAVDQLSLFHRRVSVLTLERIQDINTEVPGILGTFIGFGNMTVETAGAEEHFKIRGISNPDECKNTIIEAQERHRGTGQTSSGV